MSPGCSFTKILKRDGCRMPFLHLIIWIQPDPQAPDNDSFKENVRHEIDFTKIGNKNLIHYKITQLSKYIINYHLGIEIKLNVTDIKILQLSDFKLIYILGSKLLLKCL